MEIKYVDPKKPSDWPASNREAHLEVIFNTLQDFVKNPTYRNKEILFSLVNHSDINEFNNTGVFRITDYEVALINSIYYFSSAIHCESIKIFLYRFIAFTAQMQKMNYYIFRDSKNPIALEIEEYSHLYGALQLFYLSYAKFNYEKELSFCNSIIEFVNETLEHIKNDRDAVYNLAHSYVVMLRELSEFKSSKTFHILTFSREEITQLIKLESLLIDLSKQIPYQRPLRSMIILTIRNWVLRSRNNYSENYFYKCISEQNAEMALSNHEVWMKKIEKLNDERETVVLQELFDDSRWQKYEWSKGIDISPPKNHYVCSYTKTIPTKEMKEKYGEIVFGYKSDRISDVLSPLGMYDDHVWLGDVLYYDVIYNTDEAKDELNYLCDIINCFSFSDEEKKKFLQEILQYWFLSFKDSKWAEENERRYHIVLPEGLKKLDGKSEGDYYKSKTSIYLFPDFIFAASKVKDTIKTNLEKKLSATSTKSYLYCKNCLQTDFDYVCYRDNKTCIVCGSEDTEIIEL